MRRIESWISLAVLLAGFGAPTSAQPAFINGFPIDGGALDRTGEAGANVGRLGFFSDIYYDWERDEW